MTSTKSAAIPAPGNSVVIERAAEFLTFTLDNPNHGNEMTGPMFEAMLAALRSEASKSRARVLRFGIEPKKRRLEDMEPS